MDEFQDTNRLQIRLLGLLTGDEGRLFTVGDEFQSIYGFRHADVGVFRELRDEAAERGAVRALRTNFRSRPEILEALNDDVRAALGGRLRAARAGRGGHAGGRPAPARPERLDARRTASPPSS